MHRIIKIAAGTAGLATAALMATATAGNAATLNTDGSGFVGKGEVQSAFGWNNKAAQDNQSKVTFTAEQPTSQALTQAVSQTGVEHNFQLGVQSATQSATQAGTQVVGQDLTCEFNNGNGTKVFHRDGVRDGERAGERTGTREGQRTVARIGERVGTRTGEQAGKQVGKVASAIDAKDKVTGQYTGWYLKGFTTSVSSTVGSPVWDAPQFGDYQFGERTYGGWDFTFGGFVYRDYNFGTYSWEDVSGVEWGEWDADSGENPADCLRSQNADHITQISNVITEGDVTDGAIKDGDVTVGSTEAGAEFGEYVVNGGIEYGKITEGAVTNDGAAKVFATFGGVTKPLTITAPLV